MKFSFAPLVLLLSFTQVLHAQNVSFTPTYYTVPNAMAVAVGDFNNDGIPDLAVATGTDDPKTGQIVILLGNGDGTFQLSQSGFGVGSQPNVIAVGDFNGDGNLDLAVGNFGIFAENIKPSLSVLLGNGDGTFQPETRYPTGGNRIVVADINGDGIPDLILGAGRRGADNGLFTMLGNGDGTFQDAQNWGPECCRSMFDIAVGDFNGDGVLDVVAARLGDIQVRGEMVFLAGNGDGTLQPPVSIDTGVDYDAVVANDFNNDGLLDLSISDNNFGNGSGSTWVQLGNGDGTFSSPVPIGRLSSPKGLASADFNGDGNQDVAVAVFREAKVDVLLGNGDGTFQDPAEFILNTSQAISIAAADLNGDGLPDMVLVTFGAEDGTQQLVVMLNTTGQ